MNITKLVSGVATPILIGQIAKMLGIPQAAVSKVLTAAIPTVLAGLAGLASKPEGASSLSTALRGLGAGGVDDFIGNAGRDPAAAATSGSSFLTSLLGSGTVGTLAAKLTEYGGLPAGGGGTLLGLAGSGALAGLRSEAGSDGLDPASLARMLESQKAAIAGAVPNDFAASLKGTGLLGALGERVTPAAAPVPPRPAPVPLPGPKPRWTRWLIPLAAALLLAWLLPRFFRDEPAPVTPAPPPAAESTAPAPQTATPPAAESTAPAPQTATPPAQATAPADAAADPLVVGGVDLGATVSGALDSLTETLSGVTDAASAEAALPQLTETRDALAGIEGTAAALPEAGRSALSSLVAAGLPAIRTAADGLLANTTVGPVLQPVLTDILAKLDAFAA